MIGLLKAAGVLAAVTAAGTVATGGWAVISVRDLPEYFVAGQEYRIEFEVRQHGVRLMSQLEPRLIVRTSEPRRLLGAERGELATIPAAPLSGDGAYGATFTVPSGVERLYLVIKSGFGSGELRLYPHPVVAPGTTRPAAPLAERGRALFVAKGCNTCHANADLRDRPANQTLDVGPDLGGRRFPEAYLVAQLTRPASERMPDLRLGEAEVRALTAFLNGGRADATAGGGR